MLMAACFQENEKNSFELNRFESIPQIGTFFIETSLGNFFPNTYQIVRLLF